MAVWVTNARLRIENLVARDNARNHMSPYDFAIITVAKSAPIAVRDRLMSRIMRIFYSHPQAVSRVAVPRAAIKGYWHRVVSH